MLISNYLKLSSGEGTLSDIPSGLHENYVRWDNVMYHMDHSREIWDLHIELTFNWQRPRDKIFLLTSNNSFANFISLIHTDAFLYFTGLAWTSLGSNWKTGDCGAGRTRWGCRGRSGREWWRPRRFWRLPRSWRWPAPWGRTHLTRNSEIEHIITLFE